jgi:hypothetical protein
MAAKRPRKTLKVGARVRDKVTRRTGEIDQVDDVDGQEQFSVSFDEAPQDRFITTPAKDGAQRPKQLLEPE